MEKKYIIICLLVISMFFYSCNSNKVNDNIPDVYQTESNNDTQISISNDSDAADLNQTPAINTISKKKKNAFQEFFTFGNGDQYIRLDETNVFINNIMGLGEQKGNIVVRTDNGMAGFASYYTASYYIIQFDAANINILSRAFDSYCNDFENKRLLRKGKHTERTYGKIEYRLDWGAISSSTPNNGIGEGYLGYKFIKGNPYFCISNYPFENKYYERVGEATSRESETIQYYFTRSQAKKLIELLSSDEVKSLMYQAGQPFIPTEKDVY